MDNQIASFLIALFLKIKSSLSVNVSACKFAAFLKLPPIFSHHFTSLKSAGATAADFHTINYKFRRGVKILFILAQASQIIDDFGDLNNC